MVMKGATKQHRTPKCSTRHARNTASTFRPQWEHPWPLIHRLFTRFPSFPHLTTLISTSVLLIMQIGQCENRGSEGHTEVDPPWVNQNKKVSIFFGIWRWCGDVRQLLRSRALRYQSSTHLETFCYLSAWPNDWRAGPEGRLGVNQLQAPTNFASPLWSGVGRGGLGVVTLISWLTWHD